MFGTPKKQAGERNWICLRERNTIKRKGRKSFTCLHEKKLKANRWGKNITLQSPSALNKTIIHFSPKDLQLWLALESALNQSVHPSWAGWHPQGLSLTSGALSPKLFWPQKKCLRSLPSQGPTSAHLLVPPHLPALAQIELGFQTHPKGILRSLA